MLARLHLMDDQGGKRSEGWSWGLGFERGAIIFILPLGCRNVCGRFGRGCGCGWPPCRWECYPGAGTGYALGNAMLKRLGDDNASLFSLFFNQF